MQRESLRTLFALCAPISRILFRQTAEDSHVSSPSIALKVKRLSHHFLEFLESDGHGLA